jgi:hypothetical protein
MTRLLYMPDSRATVSISTHSTGTEVQWNQTAITSQEVLPAAFPAEIAERYPAWLGDVYRRIEELSQRTKGWDSYDGEPLSEDSANALFAVLRLLSPFIQSEPTISLSGEGGLVAEWESSQSSLELVATGSEVGVYYREEASDREWDMPASKCRQLDKWLWRASSSM